MTTQASLLPMDLINNILSFRPVHPVAKLIQELKKKCNLCMICMESPRYNDCECCSSTCQIQMNDSFGYYEEFTFEGHQFTHLMRL